MDAPLIAPSARKHSIRDDDMIHAFDNPIFVDELDEGFTMFIGADPAANLLEIGVVDTSAARSLCTPCPPDRST